ncbi:DUF3870 domain-containing protein [Sporomusa sp.]|uniref:DUF3870 domain-containing protein n=1 Tax=Sporomusa sp. TaxID=2078658 RepID=UPI002BE8EB5F|nr:DUF3870 domain-containing protein [Sporomusa sp.]HWR07145.1 DUF3870 domain-containing protein [Sporomusa sp.]
MGINEDIFLFSGYARLPAGTTASEMYKVLALVVLIDMKTGTIVDADCTLSTPVSERFLAHILVGSSLTNGVEELAKQINAVYHGSAKKTIMTALRVIFDKYSTLAKTRMTDIST